MFQTRYIRSNCPLSVQTRLLVLATVCQCADLWPQESIRAARRTLARGRLTRRRLTQAATDVLDASACYAAFLLLLLVQVATGTYRTLPRRRKYSLADYAAADRSAVIVCEQCGKTPCHADDCGMADPLADAVYGILPGEVSSSALTVQEQNDRLDDVAAYWSDAHRCELPDDIGQPDYDGPFALGSPWTDCPDCGLASECQCRWALATDDTPAPPAVFGVTRIISDTDWAKMPHVNVDWDGNVVDDYQCDTCGNTLTADEVRVTEYGGTFCQRHYEERAEEGSLADWLDECYPVPPVEPIAVATLTPAERNGHKADELSVAPSASASGDPIAVRAPRPKRPVKTTPRQPRSAIDPATVKQARELIGAGQSQRAVAKALGVSRTSLQRALANPVT